MSVRTKLSVCLRKTRFVSEADATGFAERNSFDLRPYRCDRCGQFHLTSRTRGKRVARPQIQP